MSIGSGWPPVPEIILPRRGFLTLCSQLVVGGWTMRYERAPLLFSRSHLWVRLTDRIALVGLSGYATEELGDMVYVQLPSVGTDMEVNQPFATIEAVKTVIELPSPVTGSVIRVNDALEDAPNLINSSPYGRGWLVEFRLADGAGTSHLLSHKAYHRSIKRS